MTRQETAETLALQALGWLAGEETLFHAFLGTTGASAQDVAQAAARPEFLGAVLDFLLTEDAHVIAFCDATGNPYAAPMLARAYLPGGEATYQS